MSSIMGGEKMYWMLIQGAWYLGLSFQSMFLDLHVSSAVDRCGKHPFKTQAWKLCL